MEKLPTLYKVGTMENIKNATLTISLTINACVILLFVINAAVGFICKKYSAKVKWFHKISVLHQRKSWLLPKVITEELVSLVLLLGTIAAFFKTQIFYNAFVPDEKSELLNVLFAINVGKLLFKIGSAFLAFYLSLDLFVFMVYDILAIICYFVIVLYQENYALGVIGILMEVAVIYRNGENILRYADVKPNSRITYMAAIGSCFDSLFMRMFLPIILLIIFSNYQSPFHMSVVPVSFFFFNVVSFAIHGVYLFIRATMKIKYIIDYKKSSIPKYGYQDKKTANTYMQELPYFNRQNQSPSQKSLCSYIPIDGIIGAHPLKTPTAQGILQQKQNAHLRKPALGYVHKPRASQKNTHTRNKSMVGLQFGNLTPEGHLAVIPEADEDKSEV